MFSTSLVDRASIPGFSKARVESRKWGLSVLSPGWIEIVEDLQAAIDQFAQIAADLGVGERDGGSG
jgi:hypothetical protein